MVQEKKWSKRNSGGLGHRGGGGPPAQPSANGGAPETKEKPRKEGGGRNPSPGKGEVEFGHGDGQGGRPAMEGGGGIGARSNAQESGAPEMPTKQDHPADPVGQGEVTGRQNKEDDGSTGVANPEVAAGAMDARSMGVAGPKDKASVGAANVGSGEEAALANPHTDGFGRKRSGGAARKLATRAAAESGGGGQAKTAVNGQMERDLAGGGNVFGCAEALMG
ncbi:glycine-rich cell wall structural protein 1.0-like [Drosophila ananassae]|uniref:glycine-rich cell wall structural protein 1.0-like n=1 Tax=Drosophila ananassae TaxID=7217 RepID=UPI001D00078F|nr:glycine-rich cell wall structural protein 1.0-like [Drosophila ananassae]